MGPGLRRDDTCLFTKYASVANKKGGFRLPFVGCSRAVKWEAGDAGWEIVDDRASYRDWLLGEKLSHSGSMAKLFNNADGSIRRCERHEYPVRRCLCFLHALYERAKRRHVKDCHIG
jgi:hypothetical protein